MNEVMRGIMQALNIMGSGKEKREAVGHELEVTHRTLQQEYMRTVVLPSLQKLDDMYHRGWYDARNAASCMLAHKMLEAVKEDDLYLPFI